MSSSRQGTQRSHRRSSWQGCSPSTLAPIREYNHSDLNFKVPLAIPHAEPGLPLGFNVARLRREMTTASLLTLDDVVQFDRNRPAHVSPYKRRRSMPISGSPSCYETGDVLKKCRTSVSFAKNETVYHPAISTADILNVHESDVLSVSSMAPTRSGHSLRRQQRPRYMCFLGWLCCIPLRNTLFRGLHTKHEATRNSPSSQSESSSLTAISDVKSSDKSVSSNESISIGHGNYDERDNWHFVSEFN